LLPPMTVFLQLAASIRSGCVSAYLTDFSPVYRKKNVLCPGYARLLLDGRIPYEAGPAVNRLSNHAAPCL